jgi:tetratricopeptide (TPR) repeat protein
VDQQTKAALKQDKFVSTTTHGIEWASEHTRTLLVNGAIVLAAIIVVVVGAVVYNSRSEKASVDFGAAMQAYQTPLAQPGEAVPPGVKTYATATERAKAANALFQAVADKYGMTPSGQNARYFAGLTEIEAGQSQQAEETLKKVAGGWNKDVAGLAKFALAQIYQNSGRDSQATDLYNQMIKKPTETVPASLAKLQLADLYQSEGKTDQAKTIYADLKDKDAKGAAGTIAAERLNPTAGRAPLQ